MKLSKDTLTILKNFSTINTNLTLNPGNVLKTISVRKDVAASAVVAENFPTEFGIYSLPDFLGALSLFETPELSFNDKFITISEGSTSIDFYGAVVSLLLVSPGKSQTEDVTATSKPVRSLGFKMTKNLLQQFLKASAILNADTVSVVGDGHSVFLEVRNKVKNTGNIFKAVVLENVNYTFRSNMKMAIFKIILDDYDVSIYGTRMIELKATNMDLKYTIALDIDSTFEL